MKPRIACFAADDRAATAIEYALVAAGIAVAITSSVNVLGCQITQMLGQVAQDIPGQ